MTESIETTFERNEKMIKSLAWKYSQRIGTDHMDDLVAVGNLAFVEVFDKYDPRRASFTTFLYACVNRAMLSYLRKETANHHLVDDDSDDPLRIMTTCWRPNVEAVISFNQSLRNLSPYSAAAIDFVLAGNCRHEHRRGGRGEVVRHMRDCGAAWPVVWRSMREIKLMLREA